MDPLCSAAGVGQVAWSSSPRLESDESLRSEASAHQGKTARSIFTQTSVCAMCCLGPRRSQSLAGQPAPSVWQGALPTDASQSNLKVTHGHCPKRGADHTFCCWRCPASLEVTMKQDNDLLAKLYRGVRCPANHASKSLLLV